ncbi:MAG: hypothetical protein ACKVOX_11605 [Rhizobacter sp.]|jgi:hydrogenase/urease accessory protein HupE
MQTRLALLMLSAASPAFSHEGHGLGSGSHWHASDAWGYLALAAVVAVSVWAGRKK